MSILTHGDRAAAFLTRHQNFNLQSELQRLSTELSTGRKSQLTVGASGDYAPLTAIERDLATLSSYKLAGQEAAQYAGGMQSVLERVQSINGSLGPSLFAVTSPPQPTLVDNAVIDARGKFSEMVGAMNTRLGDRSLLSGAATDRPPLAASADILAALELDVSAETTAAGVIARIDAWFAPGGAFDTVAYQGSTASLAPFRTGQGEAVALDITATDPKLREALASVALAAVSRSPLMKSAPDEQMTVLRTAAERSMSSEAGLSKLRAQVGTAEATLDRAISRNSALAAGLEIEKTLLIGVDPFEAATALEATQTQLETLYSITARLSRLSLADFLR